MCRCFDYLVFSVDVSELPLVAGDAHPLVFSCQVDELPTFLPLLVILFGVVGEGVQLLVWYWRGQKKKIYIYYIAMLEWHETMTIFPFEPHRVEGGAVVSCKHHGSPSPSESQSEPPWSCGTGWPEGSRWWWATAFPPTLCGGAKSAHNRVRLAELKDKERETKGGVKAHLGLVCFACLCKGCQLMITSLNCWNNSFACLVLSLGWMKPDCAISKSIHSLVLLSCFAGGKWKTTHSSFTLCTVVTLMVSTHDSWAGIMRGDDLNIWPRWEVKKKLRNARRSIHIWSTH